MFRLKMVWSRIVLLKVVEWILHQNGSIILNECLMVNKDFDSLTTDTFMWVFYVKEINLRYGSESIALIKNVYNSQMTASKYKECVWCYLLCSDKKKILSFSGKLQLPFWPIWLQGVCFTMILWVSTNNYSLAKMLFFKIQIKCLS